MKNNLSVISKLSGVLHCGLCGFTWSFYQSHVQTNHSTLTYLMLDKDAKLRLIRWAFFFQMFNFEVKDRKGIENKLLISCPNYKKSNDEVS